MHQYSRNRKTVDGILTMVSITNHASFNNQPLLDNLFTLFDSALSVVTLQGFQSFYFSCSVLQLPCFISVFYIIFSTSCMAKEKRKLVFFIPPVIHLWKKKGCIKLENLFGKETFIDLIFSFLDFTILMKFTRNTFSVGI